MLNSYLTRLIIQILINNKESRDDWMLTVKEVHDREMMVWYINKSEYYDAIFSNKLSNVQTITRIWRLAQEKRPELRGEQWEQRQKLAGIISDEMVDENNVQYKLNFYE